MHNYVDIITTQLYILYKNLFNKFSIFYVCSYNKSGQLWTDWSWTSPWSLALVLGVSRTKDKKCRFIKAFVSIKTTSSFTKNIGHVGTITP